MNRFFSMVVLCAAVLALIQSIAHARCNQSICNQAIQVQQFAVPYVAPVIQPQVQQFVVPQAVYAAPIVQQQVVAQVVQPVAVHQRSSRIIQRQRFRPRPVRQRTVLRQSIR